MTTRLKSHIALFLIVVSLLVTACAGAAATPTATPSPPPSPSPAPSATPTEEPTRAAEAVSAGCTVNSLLPTPDPDATSPFPPVDEEDWIHGPEEATVTFLEYSDFQCPGCAALAPVLAKLEEEFPTDVRVVYRHFPLVTVHENATLAAQAAESAGAQGAFWEMHDVLFGRQAEWADLSESDFEAWLLERAEELELDVDAFEAELRAPEIEEDIEAAHAFGSEVGIPGTPFLIINGRPYGGPLDIGNLTAIVKLLQLSERQFERCPEMDVDPAKEYFATLHTEKGDIVLQLFPDIAPVAVNSFVFLIQEDWYDGVTFHRVLPDFVAQAGDPSGTGFGGPGYAFENETDPDLTFDRAGLLAMANAGPDSNGSQFFITYGPQPQLNGQYTIFGEVIEGMEVVEDLSPRNPQTGPDLPPGDEILDVTIEER